MSETWDTHSWKQLTPLGLELLGHPHTPLIGKILIPARANMKARSPRADHVRCPHTISGIHKTQTVPVESRDGPCVASASIAAVSEATRDVDLFFKRHLGNKGARLDVGICP
jgi:hypothetical protein